MERKIWQLLILTLIGTIGEALSDPTDDKIKLEPRYSDILRLKRGTRGNDEEGADVCSSLQLNMLNKMYTECNKKADSPVELALNSKKEFDVFAVFCQAIGSKVGCINTIAPSCLKPDRVNIMKLNYLAEQAAKAKNSSSLGQYFIDSCPELRNYQNELVQIVYGSSKCSYAQALDYKNTLDLCQNNTSTNFDRKVNLVADFLQSAPKEERL